MDARNAGRVITTFPAEIICGEKRYAGSVENLSPDGAYLVTGPVKIPMEFAPDLFLALKFHVPTGETLDLHCRIKWSYPTPPHGYTHSIGVEIIAPPLIYMEILKNLG